MIIGSDSVAGKIANAVNSIFYGSKPPTPKAIGPAGDAGGTVTKQLPSKMQSNARTSDKGNGNLFKDPDNPKGNNVRVQKGNPDSSYPAQRKPYVKETRGGKVIDKNGKPVSSESPEVHIAKEEYKYNK